MEFEKKQRAKEEVKGPKTESSSKMKRITCLEHFDLLEEQRAMAWEG